MGGFKPASSGDKHFPFNFHFELENEFMNTPKALGIVLFVGAAALLGVVFYNYSLSGTMGYTSIFIALLSVSLGLFMLRKK